MKSVIGFVVGVVISTSSFGAKDEISTRCNIAECFAGSKVVTYAKKGDGYFACPTAELADYTNYVRGLVGMVYGLTGRMPNISPVTGDPEQTGKSKELLDALRSLAKVRTFDQAAALCKEGRGAVKATVLNNPKDGMSIWVGDAKTDSAFWMPKGSANLR